MDAVLFDMDGVLVDSEDHWHDAYRDRVFPTVLAGDEWPAPDEVTGRYYLDTYDYLDEEYETAVSKADHERLFNEIAADLYGERVSLLDGTHDLLDTLRDAGIPTGLVSSSPPDWIGIVTDRFDLEFDVVRSVEDIDGPAKPAPDIYEAAAADLGVDPANCVVVEDSWAGTTAGDRAGAFVVAIRGEHNAKTDLTAADVVVNSPDDLRTVLLERL